MEESGIAVNNSQQIILSIPVLWVIFTSGLVLHYSVLFLILLHIFSWPNSHNYLTVLFISDLVFSFSFVLSFLTLMLFLFLKTRHQTTYPEDAD